MNMMKESNLGLQRIRCVNNNECYSVFVTLFSQNSLMQ